MSAKFTPGPWVIETSGWSGGGGHTGGSIGAVDKSCGTFRIDSDGRPVLQYRSKTILNYTLTGNGFEDSVNMANAKLITAAPDLLAALELVTARLVSVITLEGYPEESIDEARQARAAIARAKGETA